MSSTLTIPSRPSPSFSWADDDDDFDFEAWKSTADISAPSPKSLPPLQLPAAEVEPSFTTTIPSPCVTAEPDQASAMNCNTCFIKAVHVCRLMADAVDAPAYPEMSAWGKEKRVSYAANWVRMKVDRGRDCRETMLFRGSGLRQVEICEKEEEVDILAIKLAGEDVEDVEVKEFGVSICLEEDGTNEIQLSTTPPGSPPSFKITTLDTSMYTLDEGYYSDTSPPVSPTLPASQEDLETSTYTEQVDMLPAHEATQKYSRRDSFEVLRSDEGEHSCTLKDASPDLAHIDDTPTFSTYLYNTMATGWFLVSQLPWTDTGMAARGLGAAGLMHFMRQQ